MDMGGNDEDTKATDEHQDDRDIGRQLENEPPHFTITNTVNTGIRMTLKSQLDSPSLSFDNNGTLTENLEFEFSHLARTTPVSERQAQHLVEELPVVIISDVANSVTLAGTGEGYRKGATMDAMYEYYFELLNFYNLYIHFGHHFTGYHMWLLLFMEPELKKCKEEEYQCNVDVCCLTVSGLKKWNNMGVKFMPNH
ncbi:hypothetical protein F5876DRAFT_69928 [Lentinula aff. lateritia]|uniref:Uncharacterized protein n=1 Tax=Lentinula aff. lateritia TaxID=2804960 RepID=A0ACC1TKL6_9AGAR|nr:hypothetical protein F5876DRAFT_69928 [Lentinula aff. lateritia]